MPFHPGMPEGSIPFSMIHFRSATGGDIFVAMTEMRPTVLDCLGTVSDRVLPILALDCDLLFHRRHHGTLYIAGSDALQPPNTPNIVGKTNLRAWCLPASRIYLLASSRFVPL